MQLAPEGGKLGAGEVVLELDGLQPQLRGLIIALAELEIVVDGEGHRDKPAIGQEIERQHGERVVGVAVQVQLDRGARGQQDVGQNPAEIAHMRHGEVEAQAAQHDLPEL